MGTDISSLESGLTNDTGSLGRTYSGNRGFESNDTGFVRANTTASQSCDLGEVIIRAIAAIAVVFATFKASIVK